MTIAALLRHHGVTVPRYVTINGQIVFDDVQSTPSGPVHIALGPVTPVAVHTFHGGTDEPSDNHDRAAPWWEDEDRINRHVDAMKHAFPDFVYIPAEEDMGPCWGGVLNTGRGHFKVLIMTRKDEGLPRIMVMGPRLGVHAGRKWIPSPHLYLNGNLCVADQQDWDPHEHTVATATTWAAHWLAAYTEWRMTRRWPVEGVHAVAA